MQISPGDELVSSFDGSILEVEAVQRTVSLGGEESAVKLRDRSGYPHVLTLPEVTRRVKSGLLVHKRSEVIQ